MPPRLDDKPEASRETSPDEYDFNDPDFDDIKQSTAGLQDQLGALERDKINGLEQNAAGSQEDSANENPMNFARGDASMADKAPGKSRFSAWLGRNKAVVAGGGGAIILLGGLFTITMPLKLQGILSQIENTTAGRLEGYVENRTKKIIFQAIFHNIGVEDRNLVKGGSLVERVAKTMATNKFEERLAAKGIEFFKDGEGVVKVRLSDPTKGLVIKTGRFKTVSEVQTFIDGIPVSKAVMQSIIKEDLGIWGYFARGKLAKWMLSYLGISRFGTKTTDKNATPEEKIQSQAVDDITNDLSAKGKALENGLELQTNAENIGKAEEQVASADQLAASKQSIRDAVNTALNDAKTTISKTTGEAMVKAVSKISAELGTKLSELILKKAGTKLVPGYGEVVMVAMGIVFTHWALNNIENGNAARALAMPAAILMGYSYGVWQGYASQAKEGTLDTDLYNYFTPFLDNVEISGLFNCVDTNWQTGCDTVGQPVYKKLNETNNELLNGLASVAKLDPFMGALVKEDWSPIYLLGRLVFNIDNAISGVVVDGIMSYLKSVLDFGTLLVQWAIPDNVKADLQAQADAMFASAGQFMLNNILTMFGLNIGPTMAGNQLFDILVNGGTYTANRFMETSLAMHQISPLAAAAQTQQYIAEQQEYNKSKGVLYALFSPEATNSVTSRLVSKMSYGGGATNAASNTVASLFGLVKSTPSSLASVLTNSASAASYTSPEAVLNAVPFGITDAEADADVSAAVLSGQPCSTTSIGSGIADWFGISPDTENVPYDSCTLDTNVAQSILCSMDDSIRETVECNPDAGGATALNSTSGSCPVVNGVATGLVSGITTGWDRSGNQQSITLCTIPDTSMSTIPHWASDTRYAGTSAAGVKEIAVNSEAAASLLNAAQYAQKDGVKLSASVGYRSLYEQCSIVMKPGNLGKLPSVCPSWVTAVPGNWTSTTIYSNHMMGYSIDFYQQGENWMRACVHNDTSTYKNASDGNATDNRCFGFYDDVYQNDGWDSAHFTYKP